MNSFKSKSTDNLKLYYQFTFQFRIVPKKGTNFDNIASLHIKHGNEKKNYIFNLKY